MRNSAVYTNTNIVVTRVQQPHIRHEMITKYEFSSLLVFFHRYKKDERERDNEAVVAGCLRDK